MSITTPPPSASGARRHVVVAGATGLVGRALVAALSLRHDVRVAALTRAAGRAPLPAEVEEAVFDYDDDESYRRIGRELPCDVLYCCLGTTRRVAGSDEAFRRVDLEYPRRLFARAAALVQRPVVGLVSSLGADQPRGLYLETKAEAEAALLETRLPHVIVRPSLLLGERPELRPAERAAQLVFGPLGRLVRVVAPKSALLRYAPIEAGRVAAALVHFTLDRPGRAAYAIEGPGLFDPAAFVPPARPSGG
ncbi:MAG TPA: NAD(P)H-binding protein [Polyangiaceae bacterium]|nr:NAD(P)H-binding protein [Polyangiaceae bacterium]